MRLRHLWIGSFRNLSDLSIDFDDSPSIYGEVSIRYFVGVNGSGKSSALEAIGLIFSHLAAASPVGFEFDLEYRMGERDIRITSRVPEIAQAFRLSDDECAEARLSQIGAALMVRSADTREWTKDHLRNQWASSGDDILPAIVVGYSTGPTSEFQWALAQSAGRSMAEKYHWDVAHRALPPSPSENWQDSGDDSLVELELMREQLLNNPRTLSMNADDSLLCVLALLIHPDVTSSEDILLRQSRDHILAKIGLDVHEPLLAFSIDVPADWQDRLSISKRKQLEVLVRAATVRVPISNMFSSGNESAEYVGTSFRAVFDLAAEFSGEIVRQVAATPSNSSSCF